MKLEVFNEEMLKFTRDGKEHLVLNQFVIISKRIYLLPDRISKLEDDDLYFGYNKVVGYNKLGKLIGLFEFYKNEKLMIIDAYSYNYFLPKKICLSYDIKRVFVFVVK